MITKLPMLINRLQAQNQKRPGSVACALALAACFALTHQLGSIAFADTASSTVKNEAEAKNYNHDNTGRNVRDRNDTRVTADDQKMAGAELEVLARIRREIIANDALSTNAHNVKIVVENGKVVLRGPVKSAEEKTWIQGAAARMATGYSVDNQLEIAPS